VLAPHETRRHAGGRRNGSWNLIASEPGRLYPNHDKGKGITASRCNSTWGDVRGALADASRRRRFVVADHLRKLANHLLLAQQPEAGRSPCAGAGATARSRDSDDREFDPHCRPVGLLGLIFVYSGVRPAWCVIFPPPAAHRGDRSLNGACDFTSVPLHSHRATVSELATDVPIAQGICVAADVVVIEGPSRLRGARQVGGKDDAPARAPA